MSIERFQACMADVLPQECPCPSDWSNPRNYSVDPIPTQCGITQPEFTMYLKHEGLPAANIKNITPQQGSDIYYNYYWMPHCDDLPAGVDLSFFDSSINQGPHQATMILQVALGIPSDGEWGPQTAMAVKGIFNAKEVITNFTARRKLVYQATRGFGSYGADWIRRATEIGQQALEMAA